MAESEQLQQLRQLRARCDDAQDFLVGLIHAHLQDEPPAAAMRLLTAAASRQLNIAALNRSCVQSFLDKQLQASPADMAGLMAALSLVRCCSRNSHQVQGLDQHQLGALFSGTMTHLVAHVERALASNQQQQQQQQQAAQPAAAPSSSSGRTRRAAAAAAAAAHADAAADAAASELRQQVAAGLAAHVSARVPLASSLIPHVVGLLGHQAPASSTTVLQALGSLLAAARQQQQQQQQQRVDVEEPDYWLSVLIRQPAAVAAGPAGKPGPWLAV
ncbi:hypothetical protein OEZ85_002032 [Tetradesmus obliquus]|uniref:Uncharacterized protein n=1 Tax=Tetradesmus obliquus TaxID=3088 RepID=A0ABY8U3Z1_TETOB|nr:hypothetical protein OEZ85_002032 [Tetradesmus obliquus]